MFAYSAGAQLVAPALASLADKHGAGFAKTLRAGRFYLAAPDVSTRTFFTEYLPAFEEHVEDIAFTYNCGDPFLKYANALSDVRLGRPIAKGTDPEELAWLRECSKRPAVQAIDLDYETAKRPVRFNIHSTWRRNPWVASDVVLFLLHGDTPKQRGLEAKPDGSGWFFPTDYAHKLREITEREGYGTRLSRRQRR